MDNNLVANNQFTDNNQFVILTNPSGDLPWIHQQLESLGEVVRLDQIGVLIVEIDQESDSEQFLETASNLPGVQSVTYDLESQWIEPVQQVVGISFDEVDDLLNPNATDNPPNSGEDDFFFDLQWGHDAIDAPEAWEAGSRGEGVRVAVLDGGFDLDHPDLAPNINLELSTNFVDGETLQYGLNDPFSHGTHVAGTIAAADNGFGTIGVAPEAELMLVKVLSDQGFGTFGDIISGIMYAADNDADVINMSLGADIARNDPGASELFTALGRAINYAYQKGVTIIAAAGNDARDLNKDKSLKSIVAETQHVISISATAPIDWAIDAETNLDVPTSYTNFGKSAIDFAAPGGELWGSNQPATVAGITRPSAIFDLVFSTGNGGWYWTGGTSMAAPHAAGVAALIIGANGGDMHPAHVKAALRSGADDLGKPGRDPFYGRGRINAFSSVES